MNKLKHIYVGDFSFKKSFALFILLISFSSIYSQLSIEGTQMICLGETEVYELINADPATNYTWTITPSQAINQQAYNQSIIQWNAAGTFTISITGGPSPVTRVVTVYEAQIPLITFDNEVGCQKLIVEQGVQSNVMEENECIEVCEYSEVTYTVHGTLIGGYNYSNFDWAVTGGNIIMADNVLLPSPVTNVTGGGKISGTVTSVVVLWDAAGTGSLSVIETIPYANNNGNPYATPYTHCKPKTKTLCLDIIESPVADFLVDDLTTLPTSCYEVCLNHDVNFKDMSTASANSPIMFWEWDFGDGTAISHLQNPSHKYIDPGTFEVVLKVTNKCGCIDIFTFDICVDELPAPQIECPSLICENERFRYTLIDQCSPIIWSITGGSIIQQQDPTVTVEWNAVGADGYGYLGVDGSYCDDVCSAITKIKVPVIKSIGTIEGPTNTCVSSSYFFQLPAWPATNFQWSLTSNTNQATFGSYDENSHLVEILTGGTEGSFVLECIYENTMTDITCKGSASLTVISRKKPLINIPEKICVNTTTIATLSYYTTINGTTTWQIEDPNGNLTPYTTGTGIDNITFPANPFPVAGEYKIYASNPLSFCDPDFSVIEVVDYPAAPTAIFGEDYVCIDYPYNYSVDLMENTISEWSVSGGSIIGSIYGNTINASWTNATTKNISVNRTWEEIPGCTSANYTKTINHIVIAGSITGPTSVSEDGTNNYSLVLSNGVVGETFNWIVPAADGGISSGQSTINPSVTWLHKGVPSSTSLLSCEVTKCGVTETIILPITILGNTIITNMTGPNGICSNELTPATWTIAYSGITPNSILWDFGDGTKITQSPIAGSPVVMTHKYINTTNTNQVYTISVQALSGINNIVSSTYTYNVTVYPSPNASLSPIDVQTYCGTMGIYPLTVSNTSSGTFSYQWYFDDYGTNLPLEIVGAITPNYTVNSTPPVTSPPSSTSDGEYWCEVISSGTPSCTTFTNKKSVLESCSGTSGGCTPMSPFGIANYAATNSCGDIQATCTTSEATPTNINSFSWSLTGPGIYTTSIPNPVTKNQSPLYSVSEAGIYNIKITVQYKDANTPTANCPLDEQAFITVPLVTDLRTGIVCNSNGTTYDLQLFDNSSKYPANATAIYEWKVNGNIVSTLPNYTMPALTPGTTQNIIFKVTSGGSVCSKSVSITIPTLPIANFSTQTTYDPTNPLKTCEGREVVFTNLSTPTTEIISNLWNFGDQSTSLMIDPIKVYIYNGSFLFRSPSLTVMDRYGCTNTKQVTIEIFDNNLSLTGTQYTPAVSSVCYGESIAPPIQPTHGGGTSPFSYQWYSGVDLLNGWISPTLAFSPPNSGAYWARVYDKHNCYLDINPTPAFINVEFPPTAYISGKQDYCEDEEIKLNAITGKPASSGLTYEWICTVNGGIHVIQTSKKFQHQVPAGTYIITLEVSEPGGCDVLSNPFIVTVHPTPAAPTISLSTIDCDEYKLQLSGSSSITPTPDFNWSSGGNGQSTYIYHGGAYRLVTTDQYGCTSSAEIDVPLSPDYYFWRFPTGCYVFCPDDLPKQVDGPWSVIFESWAWTHDGYQVKQNGGYAGFGSNSESDPLIIDLPNNGEGSGDYMWTLDNGLCKKQSDLLNISILEECCEVDLVIDHVACISPGLISFDLSVSNVPCLNPIYTILAIDNNGQSMGSITFGPPTLNQGQTNITGTFVPNANSQDVTFYIKIFCPNELCKGNATIELPPCPPVGQRIGHFNDSTRLLDIRLDIIPNPASSNTSIYYNFANDNQNEDHQYILRIIDIMGRPLKEVLLENSEGSYVLDVSSFAQGLYFVEIIDNDKQLKIERMIVNH